MPNPKAPQRSTRGHERQSELDHVVGRLRALGADPDEIADFIARWDDFDPAWTPEHRAAFVRASDATLRQAIRQGREEFDFHTDPDPVPDDQADRDDAALVIDRARNVDEVQRWVGTDVQRAAAVLEVETVGAGRKTLLAAMHRLVT